MAQLCKETHYDGREPDYPSHAWPGGDPIIYYVADGGALCPDCANGRNGSLASAELAPHEDDQWRLVACEVHWEGEPIVCDHCGAAVESAYGVPDESEDA